jgi:DnaJ-class molecular chaperone
MKMTLQKALSVFEFASIEKVNNDLLKKRYLDLAQSRHPDKGGSTETFIELKEAYAYLKRFLEESDSLNYNTYSSSKSTSSSSSSKTSNSNQSKSYSIDEEYVRQLESVNAELSEQNKSYYSVLTNYENILNKQIDVFNKMNSKLAKLANDFNVSTEKNKLERDRNTEELKKQYSPAFKDLINPFQRRIDNEEFMWRQNTIIQDFDEHKQDLENTFLNAMVEVYQASYENISDILEKNTPK